MREKKRGCRRSVAGKGGYDRDRLRGQHCSAVAERVVRETMFVDW